MTRYPTLTFPVFLKRLPRYKAARDARRIVSLSGMDLVERDQARKAIDAYFVKKADAPTVQTARFGEALRACLKKSVAAGEATSRSATLRTLGYNKSSCTGLEQGAFSPSVAKYALMCEKWPELRGLLDPATLKTRGPSAVSAVAAPAKSLIPLVADVCAFGFCALALTLMQDKSAPRWVELIEMADRGGYPPRSVLQYLKSAAEVIRG